MSLQISYIIIRNHLFTTWIPSLSVCSGWIIPQKHGMNLVYLRIKSTFAEHFTAFLMGGINNGNKMNKAISLSNNNESSSMMLCCCMAMLFKSYCTG
jgi:hypothetical protein